MKKLSEFTEKECIHIDNENDWKRIVPKESELHHIWNDEKQNSCYYPKKEHYSSIEHAIEFKYTIYQPSDVILEDDYVITKSEIDQLKRILIDDDSHSAHYLRVEITKNIIPHLFEQTEKTKAIETIKDLMLKHEIKKEEL